MAGSRRRRITSVRARITLAATVIVAAALVAASVVLVVLLRAGLVRSVAAEAKVRAAELAALSSNGPLPVPLPSLAAPWPTLVQVIDPEGRVVTANAELGGRPPLLQVDAADREQVREVHAPLGHGGHVWRVESVPATLDGRSMTVIVATAIDQFDQSARLLGALLLVGVPILVALVAVVTWGVVGRALRPVEAMRRQVAGVSGRRVGRRIADEGGDDEIARLGRTLNAMLERLDEAGTRQDQFVADASHELRSPLANIQVALEVAKAHPIHADWPAVADDVLMQDKRMQTLVDDLLVLARGDGGGVRTWTSHVDLSMVVSGVLASPTFDRAPVRIDALQPTMVLGGRAELTRVVTNLLDNCLRFAANQVTVSVTARGRWAELVVADDGPGIAAADRDRVFDRFVRLDEHRSRHGGGAGLGLAIVKELVIAHGGAITVGDAHPGATFSVRLPLAEIEAPAAADLGP
jgi:signal transduction histidine kinase